MGVQSNTNLAPLPRLPIRVLGAYLYRGFSARVEAGSVAHIGRNDVVFSMEPPCALELRDLDTRFVFSAQPRERRFGDNRCRKDRLERARDPLFMSCLTQGHTQRLWGLSA